MYPFENHSFDLFLFLGVIYLTLKLYYSYCYKYWKRLGIPYVEPKLLLGNSLSFFPRYTVPGTVCVEFYNQVRKLGYKYAGIYLGNAPNIVINDPDIIKNIIIKDFEHFVDRGMYNVKESDLLTGHLFNADESDWRSMRNKLSPTFTSGKMKMMYNLVLDVTENMIDFLKVKSEFDAKELMRCFTIDVIGICAFGINCNSFKTPDAEFVQMSKEIFYKTWTDRIKFFFIVNFRSICKKVGVTVARKEVTEFFRRITRETVKNREDNGINRGDFIQLLIEIRKKLGDEHFNLDDMTSQTFLFFVAGFDTSSTALSFALYELAKRPDVQERLREEINETLAKTNGEITYECLAEMKYLQMVIDETLRLYPSVPSINRKCTKDYIIPGTNHKIERGVPVIISLLGLHRDPAYWDEPDKFDPERFTDENKKNRHPFVHLPFGTGPRNCIGLRFGLMQTRLGIVRIIKDFKLGLTDEVHEPIFAPNFLLASEEPIRLKVERI